jgi:hypothetical protein
VFTRALHWSLSPARSLQSISPHPISLRSILILSTHLRFGFSSGLFPYSFPANILCICNLLSPIRDKCPAHLILLDLIILIILGEECPTIFGESIPHRILKKSVKRLTEYFELSSNGFTLLWVNMAEKKDYPTAFRGLSRQFQQTL